MSSVRFVKLPTIKTTVLLLQLQGQSLSCRCFFHSTWTYHLYCLLLCSFGNDCVFGFMDICPNVINPNDNLPFSRKVIPLEQRVINLAISRSVIAGI